MKLDLNFLYFFVLCLVFSQVHADEYPNCTMICADLQACDFTNFQPEYCTISMMECWHKLNCWNFNLCLESGIYQNQYNYSQYYICFNNSDSQFGFDKYYFTCPNNQTFDSYRVRCVDPIHPLIDGKPKPQATEKPTELQTPEKPTEKLPIPVLEPQHFVTDLIPPKYQVSPTLYEFHCPAPGVFKHPYDCKIYFWCNQLLEATAYICPGETYYNENLLECSGIITPDCYEHITQPILSAQGKSSSN